MLILTRRQGEAITLTIEGKTVTICVHEIKGAAVKLAIDAPQEIRVMRKELVK